MGKRNDVWEPVGTVYRKKPDGGGNGWTIALGIFIVLMIIGALA